MNAFVCIEEPNIRSGGGAVQSSCSSECLIRFGHILCRKVLSIMGNSQSHSLDDLSLKSRHSRQYGSSQGKSDTRGTSPAVIKRKRGNSGESIGDYGFFDELESNSAYNSFTSEYTVQPLHKVLTLPAPASEPPLYILESSLETQQLWYRTAGRRPVQPPHEREKIEKEWSQNFEASEIEYDQHQVGDSRKSEYSDKSESPYEVMYRGKSPFSNSVSKSFTGQTVSSMTIQMPFYRIVRDQNGKLFAEYLIVVSVGGRGSVTFGVWKRHSEFERLAKFIAEVDALSNKPAYTFKNTLLSWQCVVQRKRWFKSLEADYLTLKCFLLERFMQDLLFEAHSVHIVTDFLGL